MKIKAEELSNFIHMDFANHRYTLNLSKQEVNDVDLLCIARFLNENAHVHGLDLFWNSIGPDGVKTLIQVPHLTSLNISCNQIGDAGIQLIINAMPNLQHLDVQANGATSIGARALAAILDRLEGYGISYHDDANHTGAHALEEASKKNNLRKEEIKRAKQEAELQRDLRIKNEMRHWDWSNHSRFVDYYFENPHFDKLSIKERYSLALENKDFREMLTIAKFFRNQEPYIHGALNALCKALEMKPETISIEGMKLDEFLSTFTYLDSPVIFRKGVDPLLDALKRNTTIKSFYFPGFKFDGDYVNEYFADYLAETKTLESLEISTAPAQETEFKLKPHHMSFIAYGLRYNTSVKNVQLVNQSFNAAAINHLLTALQDNPDTKIDLINLNCSYIPLRELKLEKFQFAKSFTLYLDNGGKTFSTYEETKKESVAKQKESLLMKQSFFKNLGEKAHHFTNSICPYTHP